MPCACLVTWQIRCLPCTHARLQGTTGGAMADYKMGLSVRLLELQFEVRPRDASLSTIKRSIWWEPRGTQSWLRTAAATTAALHSSLLKAAFVAVVGNRAKRRGSDMTMRGPWPWPVWCGVALRAGRPDQARRGHVCRSDRSPTTWAASCRARPPHPGYQPGGRACHLGTAGR